MLCNKYINFHVVLVLMLFIGIVSLHENFSHQQQVPSGEHSINKPIKSVPENGDLILSDTVEIYDFELAIESRNQDSNVYSEKINKHKNAFIHQQPPKTLHDTKRSYALENDESLSTRQTSVESLTNNPSHTTKKQIERSAENYGVDPDAYESQKKINVVSQEVDPLKLKDSTKELASIKADSNKACSRETNDIYEVPSTINPLNMHNMEAGQEERKLYSTVERKTESFSFNHIKEFIHAEFNNLKENAFKLLVLAHREGIAIQNSSKKTLFTAYILIKNIAEENQEVKVILKNMYGFLALFALGLLVILLFKVTSIAPDILKDYIYSLDYASQAQLKIVTAVIFLGLMFLCHTSYWFWLAFIILSLFYYWSGHRVTTTSKQTLE